MDETELIRAAQEGDQRAFEQLVRLYDQNVLRLAMNLLRSPEDANDVYQEAFLRVYKNLHTFPVRLQFSYLAVPDCDEPVPGCAAEAEGAARGKLRWWRPAKARWIAWMRWRKGARMAIRSGSLLSGQLRSGSRSAGRLDAAGTCVFEMRHYQGLRLRTIGEVVGTSEEAAKNCLFRATQKMRAALGDFV